MIELSKRELDGLLQFNKRTIVLYFYTPLCGTCQLATKMLEVTQEALPEIDVYKCNVNILFEYAQKWQISSVPCILIMNKNVILKREYAFKSISHVYTLLSQVREMNHS